MTFRPGLDAAPRGGPTTKSGGSVRRSTRCWRGSSTRRRRCCAPRSWGRRSRCRASRARHPQSALVDEDADPAAGRVPRRERQSRAEMLDAVLRDIGQVETVIAALLELARPGELRRQPTAMDSSPRDAQQVDRNSRTARSRSSPTWMACRPPPSTPIVSVRPCLTSSTTPPTP